MNMISLEEAKNYLRVDYLDDDVLIADLLQNATNLVADVARLKSEEELAGVKNAPVAILYTVAYLYEHREEADHHDLTLTLRSLLFGDRKAGF